MTTGTVWLIVGILAAGLVLFGLLMWSLYSYEGDEPPYQRRRERASLDELLEQQNRRSCEEYVEEVRDCTCGPVPDEADDDCPFHGREVSSDG